MTCSLSVVYEQFNVVSVICKNSLTRNQPVGCGSFVSLNPKKIDLISSGGCLFDVDEVLIRPILWSLVVKRTSSSRCESQISSKSSFVSAADALKWVNRGRHRLAGPFRVQPKQRSARLQILGTYRCHQLKRRHR